MEVILTEYKADAKRFVRKIMCRYLAHLPFVHEDEQDRLKACFATYSRPHNIMFNETLISKLMALQANSCSKDTVLLTETKFVVNLMIDELVDIDGNLTEDGDKKLKLQLQKRNRCKRSRKNKKKRR